jgi:hypothetical protein
MRFPENIHLCIIEAECLSEEPSGERILPVLVEHDGDIVVAALTVPEENGADGCQIQHHQ